MTKSMLKQENLRKQVESRFQTLQEVGKYRKIRPDLIPVSDDEFEVMKAKLYEDIENYGFTDMFSKQPI